MLQKIKENNSNSALHNLLTSEFFWMVAILLVFLSLGLFEASKLPLFLDTLWDEVLFVDPAANLYFGHGFKSSAWFAQLKDEFWAGYPPLYPFLLYLWMKIFGFGLSVARSLNYVLTTLSAFLLLNAIIRLNMVTLAVWRVLLLTLMLVIIGYGFDFRPGRPDILMISLSATAFLAYSIPTRNLRCLCLACICAIFPFSGLGLIAFAVIFSSLIFIYLKRAFFKEFIAIIAGLGIGSLALFSFYFINGVLKGFVASVLTNPSLSLPGAKGTLIDKFFLNISLVFDGNRSFKLLLVSITAIAMYKLVKRELKFYSLASFGVASGFIIPFTMRTVGSYPLYYDWMVCIPIAVCVCSEMSNLLRSDVQRWLRPALLGLMAVLLLFAPPLHLYSFMTHRRSLDYATIENFVDKNISLGNISRGDWIMADPMAYYALKTKIEVLFHPFYTQVISDEEKEKISVIIAKPPSVPPLKFTGDFETITNKLGGSWAETGQDMTLKTTKSLFSAEQVELKIYKRTL